MSYSTRGCIAVTRRTYPDGYGFALTYLDDNLNPAHLRDAANACVAFAFTHGDHRDRADADLVRYVAAQAEGSGSSPAWWLIEAAQLVHGWAMVGIEEAVNGMVLCGHPGFPQEEPPYRVLFDNQSCTAIIERTADKFTSLRYTGAEAAHLSALSGQDLIDEAEGQEFTA
jgi:hypothetical protein